MATTIIAPNFHVPQTPTVRIDEAPKVNVHASADVFLGTGSKTKGASEHFEKVLKKVQSNVLSLLGDDKAIAEAMGDLGENPDYEDLVAYVMMKMVRAEEQKSAELLQRIENGGHPGLKGFVAGKSADLAGVAGAAVGGVLGGWTGGAGGAAAGAAVGQDIAKRAVNSATGYAGEDSREMQMQKLTMVMQRKDRMMALFTNAVRSSHESIMRVIGNLRA